MLRALICALCVMLAPSSVLAQTRHQPKKRPRPTTTKQRPLNLEGIADPPEDEMLYDEYDRLFESRWRLATFSATDDKKKSANVYYDKEGITRPSPNHVKAWVKYADVLSGVEHGPYQLVLTEFDCLQRRTRAHAYTDYDANGKAGESMTFESGGAWHHINPDSVAEGTLKILCFGRSDLQAIYEESAARRFRSGRQAEKRQEYLSALEWYQKALDDDPGNQKIEAAIKRVEAAIARRPVPRAKSVGIVAP